MVDVPLTPVEQYYKYDNWGLFVQGTASGGETGYQLRSDSLPDLQVISDEIMVTGISLYYLAVAANETLDVEVSTYNDGNTFVQHYFPEFTAVKLVVTNKAYYPLALPARLGVAGPFIRVNGTVGATSACGLSAWGKFITPQEKTVGPLPVTVKGVEFFPKRQGLI